jgi:hypothetical protein
LAVTLTGTGSYPERTYVELRGCRVGMNYVSCSPYRVPIARLAAAQAAISGDKTETMRTA